jgi:hypothetical protein
MDTAEVSDLTDDVKSYTVGELNQLKTMTENIRDHWLSILKEISAEKEGMRMAIQLSINQAVADLETITKEIAGRAS